MSTYNQTRMEKSDTKMRQKQAFDTGEMLMA